jgi:methionyl-tRNA synthetase
VVYVWFDALINYASAVGLGTNEEMLTQWWPADLHVIGKDITRFHAVIWPAMLMAADLPLPRQIFGHGFMTKDGQRMSKSNPGTIIDPADAAARLGADPLRLFLTKEIVFGNDGDFSWGRFEEKYNVDLANNFGNLVNRVTAMAERYRQGRLVATPPGEALASAASTLVRGYIAAMDELSLDVGCQTAFRLVDATNEYIAASAPWALAKTGQDAALDQVLWTASEGLRVATVLLSPVMPESCRTILGRLGVPVTDAATLRLDRDAVIHTSGARTATRADALWPRLEPGAATSSIVTKETAVSDAPKDIPGTQTAPAPSAAPSATRAPAAAPAAPPATSSAADERLSIDEFMKIDLRVARVLTAERVPNSKKLMKLSVDLGAEQRTIVAGIAEAYEADALVGRTIAIVANLKPAKLMGIESNGMVLAASAGDGRPVLIGFEAPPPPGTRIR